MQSLSEWAVIYKHSGGHHDTLDGELRLKLREPNTRLLRPKQRNLDRNYGDGGGICVVGNVVVGHVSMTKGSIDSLAGSSPIFRIAHLDHQVANNRHVELSGSPI